MKRETITTLNPHFYVESELSSWGKRGILPDFPLRPLEFDSNVEPHHLLRIYTDKTTCVSAPDIGRRIGNIGKLAETSYLSKGILRRATLLCLKLY